MPVLKLVSEFDIELPRNLLKNMLCARGVQNAIQQAQTKLPNNLHKPLQMLQQLSQSLDGTLDEILQELHEVMQAAKIYASPSINFKFPADLIKSLKPVDILQIIGEKIPAPMNVVFNKALELAALAPLLPLIEKLKDSDLEGAFEMVMASAPMLMCMSKFDEELPRYV